MGWENRDYAQENTWRDAPNLGGVRLPTGAIRALIIVHILTFIATVVLRGDLPYLNDYLHGISSKPELDASPLTILLHPYTPTSPKGGAGSLFRTIFVVWVLWVLGRTIVQNAGTKRLLVTYFLGNLIMGGVYWVISKVFPVAASAPLDYPMGAFAAWAFFVIRDMKFEFVPVFRKFMSAATVTWIVIGISAAFSLLTWGLWGLVPYLVAGLAATAWSAAPFVEQFFGGWPKRRRKVVRPSIRQEGNSHDEDWVASESVAETERDTKSESPAEAFAAEDRELDRILAKISKEGMDALTPAERDYLESTRRAKLQSEPK